MYLPKISIVTPSYNQGRYLDETMLSILNQDYPNFEYIVIDGGSTDESVDIIKKYQDRLAYWVSQKDRGFGDAINKGFSKATGEIFCWINSDDILFPNALKIIGNYFATHPHVDMVFGDRYVIDENSQTLLKLRYQFHTELLFRYGKSIPQECSFWRRSLHEKVGGLDERYTYAIDLELWCKFARNGRMRHIPFFLGAFRRHPDAKSSTIFTKGRAEARQILINYYGKYPSPAVKRLFHISVGVLRRAYRYSGLYNFKRFLHRRLLA